MRLEQERLKTQLAWREILPVGQQRLAAALAEGGGSVTIAWVDNDPESLNLAIELSHIFHAANTAAGTRKWAVRGESRSYNRLLIRGLFVPGPETPATGMIGKAFDEIGLAYSTDGLPGNIENTPAPDSLIVVGTKPPPF